MNYLYTTMMYINVLWTQTSQQWMYMADRRSKELMDGVHEFKESGRETQVLQFRSLSMQIL